MTVLKKTQRLDGSQILNAHPTGWTRLAKRRTERSEVYRLAGSRSEPPPARRYRATTREVDVLAGSI